MTDIDLVTRANRTIIEGVPLPAGRARPLLLVVKLWPERTILLQILDLLLSLQLITLTHRLCLCPIQTPLTLFSGVRVFIVSVRLISV